MFKVNEYFDGKVKSIAFENADGQATLGVMAPGEYEFGTTSTEYMTVISGAMEIMLADESKWKTYKPFETFVVPENSKFKVKIEQESAYRCLYK